MSSWSHDKISYFSNFIFSTFLNLAIMYGDKVMKSGVHRSWVKDYYVIVHLGLTVQ